MLPMRIPVIFQATAASPPRGAIRGQIHLIPIHSIPVPLSVPVMISVQMMNSQILNFKVYVRESGNLDFIKFDKKECAYVTQKASASSKAF